MDLHDLRTKLVTRMDSERDKLSALANVSYDNVKRQNLLHILARLADYLEKAVDQTSKVGFADFVDRTRDSRTFDVEHMIAHNMAEANSDITTAGGQPFGSSSEFAAARNGVGGLILLPRGRNRSMRAMAYSEKLQRYSNENILAQTLTASFYLNQPNWARFSAETGITSQAEPSADAAALRRRAEFYLAVASKIWSKENLERLFQ
ncbi:GmrSD restriction endonuclease domain-containing protein [Paraburkholderia sp. RL18-085-BIA-A]|uniref:GmrSD restriction endonuclease domain-containing protein n=1 Tax=Paraburkholderia sp. RL18-085-BIA-A TaxID=3031633 RepID=UPI0038B714DD